MILWCPVCGSNKDPWFDRTIDPPCYIMHDRCSDCGASWNCEYDEDGVPNCTLCGNYAKDEPEDEWREY